MKFDYTKGMTARYKVSACRYKPVSSFTQALDSYDHYYVHYYKEAKQIFERLRQDESKGTVITIYDLKTDKCKDYRHGKKEEEK